MDFRTVNYILDSYLRDPFYIDHVLYKLKRLYPDVEYADLEEELMNMYAFRRQSALTKPVNIQMDDDLVDGILDSYRRDPYFYNEVVAELERYYPDLSEIDIETELMEYHDFVQDSSRSNIRPKNKKRKREIYGAISSAAKKRKIT